MYTIDASPCCLSTQSTARWAAASAFLTALLCEDSSKDVPGKWKTIAYDVQVFALPGIQGREEGNHLHQKNQLIWATRDAPLAI
jgi:hypothetical protein